MTNRKIIFASAHSYASDVRLGSAHLADAFATKGWDVLFIEQPTSSLHLLVPGNTARTARKWRSAMRSLLNGGDDGAPAGTDGRGRIRVLNVVSAIPHVNVPIFRAGWTLQNWWRHSLPSIPRQVQGLGFGSAAAIVFDSPFFFGLARALGLPAVYRYADRQINFPEITPAMLRLQEHAFRDAELIAYTAHSLAADIGQRSGPTLYLPNGVDLRPFQGSHPEPEELAGLPKPRVIFSGTVGQWLDEDLLVRAAREMPDVHFVVVGKVTSRHPDLLRSKSITRIGQIPFSRVPAFLSHCQLGIIPFDVDGMPDLVEGINPLKVYEYCAAGLPVVSYSSAELEANGAPVATYSSADEFMSAIRRSLAEDDETKRSRRRQWAAGATWDLRAGLLEDALAGL